MAPIKVNYETERFLIKNLTLVDVTNEYLGWLKDESTRRFIVTAVQVGELENLKQYVSSKIERTDCLFLGIFEKHTRAHIGNIKYEPIDLDRKCAVMGILVGEPSWRGKGVAPEVIQSSAELLNRELGIKEVILGVEKDNVAAVRAYEKIGFMPFSDTQYPPKNNVTYMRMLLHES